MITGRTSRLIPTAVLWISQLCSCAATPMPYLGEPCALLYYNSAKVSGLETSCESGSGGHPWEGNHNRHAVCFATAANDHHHARLYRIGEAHNPGPTWPLPPTEELLAVGTTNPSGLNGKEDLQIQQGPGIWHLAETQLSHVTGPIVRRKLAQLGRAQQRQVRCIEGAPAPLRAHSHWAGSWTGVLIATDLPARPLTLPWDAGVFETGRVTTARHIFDGVPITTTAVYGFPPGPTYPDARALTDRLLATITREIVVGLQGVRVVAGDFNHDESTLPQIALWKQHGWVEAQQLALALWQQQPQPTCKGATQRDLIFLSPEAAALTQRVRIKDVYMEHSSVIVDLWTKAQQQQIRRWRQPAAIPWGSINIPGWHSASLAPVHEQETSTAWYQHFAYSFENSLNGYVELDHNKDLPRRCKGRAKWTEPEQVDTDRLLCPGHGIEQDSFVTHINDIHSSSSSWNTSTRLSNEELTRIASFVQAYIPKGHFPCEPITVSMWDDTLKKYRPHAAKGADGFALQDLRQMHPGHKQQLVKWLNSLEDGQTTWPKQLLQGTVSCIAKTANSKAADSYRPIVIYSLIYRTWAAIRSKTILKGVSHLIHDTAYGFMPEKEAMQYVFAMQALVELSAQADHSADGLCGFAVDLQRCFNNLRREPVALIAKALGISDKVLNPWLDFLHNNQRRFVVRGSLRRPGQPPPPSDLLSDSPKDAL
ncbi:unnamed protein product [Effrenium voratum]|uniref:Reverse transcriptase domain-containing protein n=1 Tax=Effrenium voratum TaxID=2562239 RepID=A0AA36I5Z8_9DINO|nr:unnamed protein product [Effrenium voratum]